MKRQEREKQKSLKVNKKKLGEKQQEDGIVYTDDGKLMCPVPMVVACSKPCDSLPQSLEDGIKMDCTNPNCLFAKHLIHPECFEAMERGILIHLAKNTSAFCWSESHRKHMLWKKQCIVIFQKYLKCPCGKGVMNRDEDAWIEREKLLEPQKEYPKKKHVKTNPLPPLVHTVISCPLDIKKVKQIENHFLSSHEPKSDEKSIEDKYGPTNAPAGSIRKRRTTDSSMASSTRSISKPPSVSSTPLYSKPFVPPPPPIAVRKIPIGFNPIKSPQKNLSLETKKEQLQRLPSEIAPPPPISPSLPQPSTWSKVSKERVSKTEQSGSGDATLSNLKIDVSLSTPKPSSPASKANESKEMLSTNKESGTNNTTTTSSKSLPNNSVESYHHEIITSNSKEASVQTNLSIFYQDPRKFKETWIKVYSPINYENSDSGIHSTIDSPSFLQHHESAVTQQQQQPLSSASSKTASMMDYGECLEKERILTQHPPPGFDNFYDDKNTKSFASIKDVATKDEEEKTNNYNNPFSWEESSVSLNAEYSSFIIEQHKNEIIGDNVLEYIQIQNNPIWKDPVKQNYYKGYFLK